MEHNTEKLPASALTGKKGRKSFQIGPVDRTRALVIHTEAKFAPRNKDPARQDAVRSARSPEAKLDEAVGLARAIDLDVTEAFLLTLQKMHPATLMGPGKVEEFTGIIAATQSDLVIVNTALSAVQQRNLERAWDTKVLDRTGMILEIFGARARTREGRLQVELAHLTYQKSRLVRSWTHLERQRGGLGFVGGPGETQIESDRRLIQDRITRLERQLETVKKTRQLHRASRRKVPYPVIALVGYTNAGKSTLFNYLCQADVMAEDLLFATLDPTMRQVELSGGRAVVLSDTVGFISDLPTNLIAAFRATLEEVLEADIIVHVRDISHDDSAAQGQDVDDVLGQLGIDELDRRQVVEVWNKIDLMSTSARETALYQSKRSERDVVMLSAVTGEGCEDLLAVLDARLAKDERELDVIVAPQHGAELHWIYQNAEVLSRTDQEDGSSRLHIRVPHPKLGPLLQKEVSVVADC